MATLKRITIGIVIMALAGLCASGFQGQKPPDDYRRFQEIQPLDEPFSGFDSLNVRFIGNWPFGPSYAVAYDSARGLAFCGSGGGVYILNVSNPSNPVKVSEAIHTRGFVYGLFYDSSNNRLYIADGQGGLEIWDVSNQSSPYKLGYYFTPGYARGVYVSGSYAYVADGNSGLRIINVSNPSSPIEVGYYNTPGYAFGVYASGAYAYVADWDAGLRIIN
ncbi:MAG: LVIVD repeat-containing protein, partial [bacterium]